MKNEGNFRFEYMMLSRLKSDCDYYLGCGGRCVKHLWACDPVGQIVEMRRLMAIVPEEPDWLSAADVDRYEMMMCVEEDA